MDQLADLTAALNEIVKRIGNNSGVNTALQQIVQATNAQTAAINAKFPNWVTAPANSASAGVAGQVAYSVGFLFVCVGPSHWQRVAIADF